VQDVPVVTNPTYESGGDSAAIDAAVQEQLQQGLSLYAVNLERLRELAPDLILTQAQCEVCAVSLPQLENTLADWSGARPEILSMEPMTLKEVLDVALRIGRTIGRPEMAMQVLAAKERALQRLRNRMGLSRRTDPATLPTIACIEWMEPLMTAGHWMPDVAEMAGARAVLAEKGTPSRVIEWDALRAADPDVLAILPCGFTLAETRRDLHYLTEREGWSDLRAVQSGRVVLLEGNAYFNRPGPRLYRSIELLAEAIHPDAVDAEALAIEPWERQRLRDVASVS